MKKKITALFAAMLLAGSTLFPSYSISAANPGLAASVESEMCSADYWKARTVLPADTVLMNTQEIEKVNQDALASPDTHMYDLVGMLDAGAYDAGNLKKQLLVFDIPSSPLFLNRMEIDKDTYFSKLQTAISETALEGMQNSIPSVCVRRTNMKSFPITDILGYSADDTDDEMQLDIVSVNEPFLIRQTCVVDGIRYYYGYNSHCCGWVLAEDLAVCTSREQWLDAWQTDINSKDFLVVTQDKLTLEASLSQPYASEVTLPLGTILKLVPENLLPETLGERSTWNNYVVYLPTRDSDGKYVKQCALISQHHSVSIGFLPLTQENLLDVAFCCLGNRYGWGGMLNAMDCSNYTRTIYRCFGFDLPRNTTWQAAMPNISISMEGMDAEAKKKLLDTLPAGSLLYMRGHTMVYTGTEQGTPYVINAAGSLSDSVGECRVINTSSVILNPLTVRRANGSTWLDNLHTVLWFGHPFSIKECEVSAEKKCTEGDSFTKLSVSHNGKELIKDVHYTVTYKNGSVILTGINNYSGTLKQKINLTHKTHMVKKKVQGKKKPVLVEECKKCGKILSKK